MCLQVATCLRELAVSHPSHSWQFVIVGIRSLGMLLVIRTAMPCRFFALLSALLVCPATESRTFIHAIRISDA